MTIHKQVKDNYKSKLTTITVFLNFPGFIVLVGVYFLMMAVYYPLFFSGVALMYWPSAVTEQIMPVVKKISTVLSMEKKSCWVSVRLSLQTWYMFLKGWLPALEKAWMFLELDWNIVWSDDNTSEWGHEKSHGKTSNVFMYWIGTCPNTFYYIFYIKGDLLQDVI